MRPEGGVSSVGKGSSSAGATWFLAGGSVMIAASLGVALLAAAGALAENATNPGWKALFSGENAYRLEAAAFGLAAGVSLLVFRSHMLAGEKAARMLAETMRAHLPDLPATTDFAEAAEAASELLRRYGAESEERRSAGADRRERPLEELAEAHRDLLTHHRFTKRMLQSLRPEEVLETLAQGVRNGLGFTGAVLGVRDADGNLFFRGDPGGTGRDAVRIPCWDEGSLLARTLWNGNPLMVRSLEGQPHREEDRAVLGEENAFLVPVVRKPKRCCSVAKSCAEAACPAYGAEGLRCWTDGRARLMAGDREALLAQRRECARCDLFAVPAIVVARERPDSRRICGETTGSIVTLANEAALALEVAELYENTRIMSVTDGLTGLANYREFYLSLGKELERARRYSHTVSVLMVDVDDFKKFNDRYGHMAGDRALKSVADLLRRSVRANDTVARYGGEEFAVILPESTPTGALMLAERIKTEVAAHDFLKDLGGGRQLTVSIGIYSSEKGRDSVEQLVGFADEAVYRAKNSGKNQVVVKAYA
jgi:diguanylate cyclase (GGDEF)-like protein